MVVVNMLQEFLVRGGPVLYAVLLSAVLLWALIAQKLWFFYRESRLVSEQMTQRWQCRADRVSASARQIRSAWLSQFYGLATSGLPGIAVLIAICPLLGLLGTVTGMVHVFDVLAVTGTGNARAMSDGIAQATLPTMAGLVVALSGLYFRSRFTRLASRQRQALADRLTLMGGAHG